MPEATAIRIDGVLNDAVWQTAPAISGFLQRDPREGAPATHETEARVAYDTTALYVAVQAFDPEPPTHCRYSDAARRGVAVRLDQRARRFVSHRRSAFEFAVNPAGVKQDSYWFNDNNNDQGWDAVWDVAVSRGERGWRAAFRIPFSQLRYRPSESATFGLAIVRKIGRLNETTTWPLLARSAKGYVSSFGELTGLRLDRSPKRLEIVPYVVADVSTQRAEAGNPIAKAKDPDASIGVDLKYALSPGLTLTGTVNPDFGQVEADPAEVNLSAFETFFSERRPFFVEGSGIFRFNIDCNDGSCSQRPQLPAPRFEQPDVRPPADLTEWLRGLRDVHEDRRRACPVLDERGHQEPRVRDQRHRIPAARRPEDHEQLVAGAVR